MHCVINAFERLINIEAFFIAPPLHPFRVMLSHIICLYLRWQSWLNSTDAANKDQYVSYRHLASYLYLHVNLTTGMWHRTNVDGQLAGERGAMWYIEFVC